MILKKFNIFKKYINFIRDLRFCSFERSFDSSFNFKKKRRVQITIDKIFEIFSKCGLEPRYHNDTIRLKYCPICPKPHNDESTNLNTFVLYNTDLIYNCFRCGHRGKFTALLRNMKKKFDLDEYNISTDYSTTEIEDNGFRGNITEPIKDIESNPKFDKIINDTDNNYKISLNSIGLINEISKRHNLLNNPKCNQIKDYLINQRKLKIETLVLYKIGVSFEKFKNSNFEYLNLPCVTFPMFYPLAKDSILSVDKDKIDKQTFEYFKCDKFYIAKIKIRAIGKELKNFQRVEPSSALIWGLFGLDTVPDNAKEIVITEGEYDAMAAYQETGIPSVSLPNGATNLPAQTLPYFSKFEKIYLWMDADQPGLISALNFAKKLGDKKTYIVNSRKNDPNGPKDANDALKEFKNLKMYLQEAKCLSNDNIIRVSDIRSQVIQFLLHYNDFSGYKALSFKFFNKMTKGLRMGEFSILTGETGSGKTTFLTQLSLDFLLQRVPTLWGSFEIKNDKLASLFLMQFSKKDLRHCKIEEIEYYSEIFEKLPLYLLKFHGSQNIDEVLLTISNSIHNYDIQNIVLDNLQFMMGIATKYTNKFDLQDEIIHKLRKFATEKNVHITLVIHPRKSDEVLSVSSIFGSGKASQEADNVFILQTYKGVRIIEVAKNRFDGQIGKTVIGFDTKSCRFFELNEEEFSLYHEGKISLESIIEKGIKRSNEDPLNKEYSKLFEVPKLNDYKNQISEDEINELKFSTSDNKEAMNDVISTVDDLKILYDNNMDNNNVDISFIDDLKTKKLKELNQNKLKKLSKPNLNPSYEVLIIDNKLKSSENDVINKLDNDLNSPQIIKLKTEKSSDELIDSTTNMKLIDKDKIIDNPGTIHTNIKKKEYNIHNIDISSKVINNKVNIKTQNLNENIKKEVIDEIQSSGNKEIENENIIVSALETKKVRFVKIENKSSILNNNKKNISEGNIKYYENIGYIRKEILSKELFIENKNSNLKKNENYIDDPLLIDISKFQDIIFPKTEIIESFHTDISLNEALSISYKLFQKKPKSKVNH